MGDTRNQNVNIFFKNVIYLQKKFDGKRSQPLTKMKPKSKKSLESDSMKNLTTSMKPSKRRSIENQVKKSPVAVQMLNILDGKKGRNPVLDEKKKKEEGEISQTERGRITRQKAMVKLRAMSKVSYLNLDMFNVYR